MRKALLLPICFLALIQFGCKKDTNPINSSTPAVPTIISPENNATNVLRKPTLRWNQSDGAVSYNLQISEQSNFSSLVTEYSEITSASKSLTILQPNTLYYWRVNAANGKNVSGWCESYRFTTGTDSIVQLNFDWISVEGASFTMGNASGNPDEKPVHTVSVKSFRISKYEVTFDQYDLFCSTTGYPRSSDNSWGRGNKPVINVSWNDATEFCKWVSGQMGKIVRLPTEAEWEFAARGGKLHSGYLYSGSDSLNSVSWNFKNSVGQTHDVGTKKGNELGIFDMSGNVWEWCSDWYNEAYYSDSVSENPTGPTSGTRKVIRGGSWASFIVPGGEGEIVVYGCKVTERSNSDPKAKSHDFGFRCVVEE